MSSQSTECHEKTVDMEMASAESHQTRMQRCLSRPLDFARRNLNARTLSDAILGLSDGLTVPFALTAGLATVGTTKIVILGGLAELIAGAISMGVGGFVGAKSEKESYEETRRRCHRLVVQSPAEVEDILHAHFVQLGLDDGLAKTITNHMSTNANNSLEPFLLKHHFEAFDPGSSRPYVSCITLGLAYFLGGFVALAPYLAVPHNEVLRGLWWSIGVMAVVLCIFGYTKTCFVRGWSGRRNILAGFKGAIQMLAVGAIAAGAAVGLVRAIETSNHFNG